MSGPKAFSHTVVASTRRSWAAWEKRAIVDEAQRATSSISAVARRHGLTPATVHLAPARPPRPAARPRAAGPVCAGRALRLPLYEAERRGKLGRAGHPAQTHNGGGQPPTELAVVSTNKVRTLLPRRRISVKLAVKLRLRLAHC